MPARPVSCPAWSAVQVSWAVDGFGFGVGWGHRRRGWDRARMAVGAAGGGGGAGGGRQHGAGGGAERGYWRCGPVVPDDAAVSAVVDGWGDGGGSGRWA